MLDAAVGMVPVLRIEIGSDHGFISRGAVRAVKMRARADQIGRVDPFEIALGPKVRSEMVSSYAPVCGSFDGYSHLGVYRAFAGHNPVQARLRHPVPQLPLNG
jgi:hypothetical protein